MDIKEIALKAGLANFDNYQDDGKTLMVAEFDVTDQVIRTVESAVAELAAEQLNNKLLREALTTCVCAMQDYQAGIGITEMFDKGERLGRKALAIPASTEELDKYVAEKVKKAGKFDMWKTNPYTKVLETSIKQLTRQRDLAVNALESIAGRRIFIDNLASNVDIAMMTLDAIKESEEN